MHRKQQNSDQRRANGINSSRLLTFIDSSFFLRVIGEINDKKILEI